MILGLEGAEEKLVSRLARLANMLTADKNFSRNKKPTATMYQRHDESNLLGFFFTSERPRLY